MVGEVIAENFQPQTMEEMSGFDLNTKIPQPPMPMAMQSGDPQQAAMMQQQAAQIQAQVQAAQLNEQAIQILRGREDPGF